jgi:two-component system, cell cycle sensor histidine kinase and response regulator CckA
MRVAANPEKPAGSTPRHPLRKPPESRPLWFGPLIMLGAFLLVFGLILWLTGHNSHSTQQKDLFAKSQSLEESFRRRLRSDTDYLMLLAQERSAGKLGAALFQQRAAQYVKYHPELINISWVDADYFVKDVAPLAGNRQILGLQLDLPEPKRASRLAMARRLPAYTHPMEAIQGGSSFEIWVPVYRGDTFLGLFGGIYSCQQLLEQIVPQDQRRQYHHSLVDVAGRRLAELASTGPLDEQLQRLALITPEEESGVYLLSQSYRLGGQDWRLSVLELFCLALVFGMANALWKLKQEIEERKDAEASLKEQSQLLEEEISERQLAQEALQEQTVLLEEEVTERLQAEENLQKNRAELQNILDNSPALIYMKDTSGRYLFVNRPWRTLFQTGSVAVIGKTDLEIFPEEIAEHFMANDRRALLSEEPLELEEQAPHADGVHVYHSMKVALKDAGGRSYALCGISTDVTEHKKTEELLRQSQKLESIGRLAGGVAHDFNNMLSVIIGCAQLAMLKVPESEDVWQYLHQISRAAERSSDITRQLLAFSRKEIISPKPVDLNARILHCRQNLGRLIGEDIQQGFKLACDLWSVLIDPSQVDQILMNLSINARDSMPDGGTLSIETANVLITESGYLQPEAKPGEYVRLTLWDTGHGMDRETREHIFEPFFTTKGVGQGTGLGLATVYGIVSQNHGFIEVYSEPGEGASFQIHFPRHLAAVPKEKAPVAAACSGSGTVLLVEDDPLVSEMVRQMLDDMGYRVLQAATPLHAVEICKAQQEQIDIILTDVVMPGMNGKEMVQAIESFHPGIKVLFMSGYTSDVLAKRGVVDKGRHFIQKPFDMQVLNEKIRKVLAEAA